MRALECLVCRIPCCGWPGVTGPAPHLRQFARVRRAMADAEALGASLGELLETRRLGIIQLDRCGRIREANDRARGILLKRDGLHDQGGVLAAGHRGENAELQCLLARALPPHGVQGAGGSMKITRRKARAPLVLEMHPVRNLGAGYRAGQLGALVLVVDPAARPRVDPDLVAAVWKPYESLSASTSTSPALSLCCVTAANADFG